MSNVSSDLIWALTSKQSSFLVKRPTGTFSADPLNISGKNSKNSSGLANEKALGVSQQDGAIIVKSKVANTANKPAKNVQTIKFNKHKSSRKVAKAIATLANGYRSDLRSVAVRKASQLSRANTARKTYVSKARN